MKPSFPIYFIWEKATHSPVAATIFMACMLTVSCIALNAVHQTSSRLTWSFARDEALFYSNKLASVSPTLGVPVYAILLDGFCVLLLGVVYVASSNGMTTLFSSHSYTFNSVHCVLTYSTIAFNAFISTTVVVAQISYAIPSALLLYRRRSTDYLPPSRPFKLINAVGYIVNIVTIVWAVVLTVFFSFPTVLPATGGNMSMIFLLYLPFLFFAL